MKYNLKNVISISAIVTLIVLFSGCSVSHKKKHCDDCPKWNIEVSGTGFNYLEKIMPF
jgi:hypothetical protein